MQKMEPSPAVILCFLLLVRLESSLNLALEISPGEELSCANSGARNLQELIHTSDVIATGKVLVSQEALRGTQTAKVHYYYAYKRDAQLLVAGQSCLKVKNIYNIPRTALLKRPALFFMVREPDGELALQCYNTILGEKTFRVLDYAEALGKGELHGCMRGEMQINVCIYTLTFYSSVRRIALGQTIRCKTYAYFYLAGGDVGSTQQHGEVINPIRF